MHRNLVNDASFDQLKEFAMDSLTMLKETNPKSYEDLETHFYTKVHGKHFCDWLAEQATRNMINEDGTVGAHWTLEQTTAAAKSNGVQFDTFNEYDWNYAMNMMYSDFYGAVPNETSTYVKMAKKFLQDRDARPGKALYYYLAIKK